ncbi:MAG: SurA N-terminal domain-containing protein [Candidatus Omnitrophica bacterium]|nr:SurA N-terminal domain-containing protein [Candidatus Omnitrophota bacterium]MBU1905770.1 SurA N-terminal domain-containing protein [Candidatus Omnitrophota bacterium]
MRRIKTFICRLAIFYLLFGFSMPCCLFAESKIIAIVNSEAITQKDLNDFINFMRLQLSPEFEGSALEERVQSMKKDLLNKLIEDKLVLQEAKKNELSVDESRIRARINDIRSRYATDNGFQADLLIRGLTQADLETKIREQLLMHGIIEHAVRRNIMITPKEITAFYNQNIGKFNAEEIRKVDVVIVGSGALANKITLDLNSPKPLEDIVGEHSLSIDSLEVIERELSEEISREVFNLKTGERSKLIHHEGKYYIFRLNQIIPSRKLNLAEVQDQIKLYLFETKMQESMLKWLDELKEKSYIKIL